VRFALTSLLWLATTVALAIAVPAAWVQLNIVEEDGYAALVQKAAGDPALQSAAAAELTTRAMALIAAHGGGNHPVDSAGVRGAATAFTAGPSFPPLFANANRAAHRWLFWQAQSGDSWVIDVAPMLRDSAFREILSSYNVKVPATLTVPLSVSVPTSRSGRQPLRQGQLSRVATWAPWVSIGAAVLSIGFGVLTLAAARRRGKALTSLGVSALLVGAAGWAGIEVGGRYLDDALDQTTGDIRQIVDVMVRHAEAGMHYWLNLTLIAGVTLVGLGVMVSILGSVREKA
jgi:hypothetical protein